MKPIFDVTSAFKDMLWSAILHGGNTGEYINGVWVPDTSLDRTIHVHIQPIQDGADMDLVPDGFRDKEIVEVWTTERLYPYDRDQQREPDVITDENGRYRVLTSKDWKKIGGYYRSLAVREAS